MTNAEWCIKNGIPFKKVGTLTFLDPAYDSQLLSIGYYDINGKYNECYKDKWLGDSITKSILIWLDMEHKEPILDESERQYLSAVIKPFSGHIEYICKEVMKNRLKEFQFIKISTGNNYYDSIILPGFTPDTMYRNMELNRKYTVEELSL